MKGKFVEAQERSPNLILLWELGVLKCFEFLNSFLAYFRLLKKFLSSTIIKWGHIFPPKKDL
jgi:hypothetical protein